MPNNHSSRRFRVIRTAVTKAKRLLATRVAAADGCTDVERCGAILLQGFAPVVEVLAAFEGAAFKPDDHTTTAGETALLLAAKVRASVPKDGLSMFDTAGGRRSADDGPLPSQLCASG